MRSKWVDLGGPVHYVDWGGKGHPLVLVHGLGGSYVEWMLLAPLLARRFHVLSPDLIGFGRTPLKRRHASVDENQRLLERFLTEVVKAPAAVVGHSMGGLIAMLQAGRNPASVSELVLIDPAVPPAGREVTPVIPKALVTLVENNPFLGNIAGLVASRVVGVRGLVEGALRRAVADYDALDPDLVDALVAAEEERIRGGMPYVGWTEARSSLGAYYRDVRRFDREVTAAVTSPTLLLYGSLDPIIQVGAIRRLARRQPRWQVEILEGVGHDANFEVPERVAELILAYLRQPAAT